MEVDVVGKGKHGKGDSKGKGKSSRGDEKGGKSKGGKSDGKGKAKGPGGKGRTDERSERERNSTCHRCGKKGHYARNCYSKGVSAVEAEQEVAKEAKGVSIVEAGAAGPERPIVLALAVDAVGPPSENREIDWLLVDSGAVIHVCPRDFAPHCSTMPASRSLRIEAAGGQELGHFGSRGVQGRCGGQLLQVTFEVSGAARFEADDERAFAARGCVAVAITINSPGGSPVR